LNQIYKRVKADNGPRKTLLAVQMSDPHIDFMYTPGMNAKCNTPICCRLENGYPSDPKNAAGPWGDYNCDIPHRVLASMLDYVRDEIKPDLFFWTGDNSAHDVWENTDDEVISYVANITDSIT
jgi:sphingomyelin phosphodiesterase